MYFQSFFSEVSNDELQSDVIRVAREVGLKYAYLREQDCLAIMFHHASPNDPADFTEGFLAKRCFEFTFEMDQQVPSTEVWQAFMPGTNTVQNFIMAQNGSYQIDIRYDTDIDVEGNFSHDGYYLRIMPTANVPDLKLLEEQLMNDFPKLYDPNHSEAKLEVRFKEKPKLDLEKWNKQECLDALSGENWNQITYYCSTIAALKEVLSEFDLIRKQAASCHFHAIFKEFPSQTIAKKWIGKFGPPSYSIAHGKYVEDLDPFTFHGNYSLAGVARYPIFEKTFNDNSVIGLDVVHRKNSPPIIEVFTFDSWNPKVVEKRAKFIRKKLGTEFEKFEGELWNRFSPS